MDIIKAVEADYLNANAVNVRVGDYVKVSFKVIEGDHERIQLYEGLVTAKHGEGVKETFTVRKVAYGVGVERVFPVHSPKVASVEIVRHGKVRRAKLYFLRGKVGRAAKVQEKL